MCKASIDMNFRITKGPEHIFTRGLLFVKEGYFKWLEAQLLCSPLQFVIRSMLWLGLH